jgi:hypothetical protein
MKKKPIVLIMAVLCVAAGAGLWPAPARADQLIQIPTADRAAAPTLDYRHRLEGDDEGFGTLLVPVGLTYELMARYYNGEDGDHSVEGGLLFQILPDGVITPGIALGLWDVTNSTPWGRRGFFVLTKSLEPGQFGLPRPFERLQVTVGTGTGRFSGLLAGARLDLPGRVTLVAEYDARRFNAGFWWSPVRPLTLKGELHNGNPYAGGEFRLRF